MKKLILLIVLMSCQTDLERALSNMKSPVIVVSADSDTTNGKCLIVKDAEGTIYHDCAKAFNSLNPGDTIK